MKPRHVVYFELLQVSVYPGVQMKRFTPTAFVALMIAGALAGTGAAWADPPGGFPNTKGFDVIPDQHGKPQGQEPHGGGPHGEPAGGTHFQDKDRIAVHNYFAELERSGQCPPGLAKKHNGCMPPGQAKRWQIGARLPAGVVYYSLPPALVVQLTPPPAGYRYVRVDSDILMIGIGTSMVAAAIVDLGR